MKTSYRHDFPSCMDGAGNLTSSICACLYSGACIPRQASFPGCGLTTVISNECDCGSVRVG